MNKEIFSKWFILFLIVLTSYLMSILTFRCLDLSIVNEKQNEADQKLLIIQKENEDLKKELENLYDPDTIEKIAREDFGFVREGEIPYQIPE